MKRFLPICLVSVLLSLASEAQTINTFDVPGGINTQSMAISPLGQVTGSYGVPNTTMVRGFVRDSAGNVTTFDVNGMNTVPVAINPTGQITGLYTANAAAVAPFHSFLRQPDGTIITFDAPNAWDTEATAIDARGDIVGWMQSNWTAANWNVFQAFLRRADGSMITFDIDNAFAILPLSMNARGDVVGYWTDTTTGRGRSFLRQADGSITDIDAPATLPTNTWVYAINTRGQIVGSFTLQCPFPPGNCTTDPHSYMRNTDGSFTNIDVPNMTYTVAVAVDAKGQVTGYTYDKANQRISGFIRRTDGSVLGFGVLNSQSTIPAAMSLTGQITGVYYDVNGEHGFILTP